MFTCVVKHSQLRNLNILLMLAEFDVKNSFWSSANALKHVISGGFLH